MVTGLMPTPFHSPPSSVKWKLPSRPVQQRTQGSFSLQLLIQRAIFKGWAGHQHFSFCPQLLVAKTKFWASLAERWGLASSSQPHSWDGGSTLGVASLSILGPDHPYKYCHPHVIRTERQGKEN